MVTKGLIRSINSAGNRCVVRMPLFETASSTAPVEATATVCIPPGMFNGLVAGDIVFVAFEENALEKPVIIGKLFTNASKEGSIKTGHGVFDTIKVNTNATLPATLLFDFPEAVKSNYKDLKTPKKMADYIKWLEKFTKNVVSQLYNHFMCFKNWTQFQLQPENVEVDDGDLDTGVAIVERDLYQKENDKCEVCKKACAKKNTRQYLKVDTEKTFPNI